MALIKMVDGVVVPLSDAEIEEFEARKAEWEAGASARAASAEIDRLESEVTQRRLREAALGTDDGWLAAQEALIAAERAKL